MSILEHPLAARLLRPLAWVYGGAVRLRNRRFDGANAIRRAPVPVISVGNITVGGTGKTPLVGWLAGQLVDLGRAPAVVSRGYGGRAGRGPLVASTGSGPLVPAELCGDEPYLLASLLDGVHVIVGSDRLAGAERAATLGCDAVILDDGFQHRRLARDVDLVLIDAGDPFGNDRLLPAGRLREPLCGLARADAIIVTRSERDGSVEEIERVVREHNPSAPLLRAGHRRVGFFDGTGAELPPPRRAVAFCGIGNPARFRADLELEGLEIVAFESHRDHHPYRPEELDRLRGIAAARGAALVTTEKDRVRLQFARSEANDILALRIEAEPHDPELLRQLIGDALRRSET